VLYQLITGVAPFDGDSFSSIMFRVMQEPAVSPSDLVPDLPAGFEYVVAKALAKDPNNRYQNAGQMDLDLRNLALSNDVQALPWGLGGVRKLVDAPAGIQPLTNAWDATQVFDRPKIAPAAPTTPQLPDPLELAAQMDAEDAKRSDLARLEEALAAKHTKDAKTQAAQAVQSAAVASTGSFAPNSTAAAPMQVGLAKGVEERRKLEAAEEAAKHANASTVPLSADAVKAKQAVKASQASAESGKASTAKAADTTKPVAPKSSSSPASLDGVKPSKSAPGSRAKSSKLKLFGTAVAGIAALGVGLYALQHSGSGGKPQVANPPIATAPNTPAVPLAVASQPTDVAVPLAAASAAVAAPASSAAQAGASAPVAVASAAADAASDAAAQQDGRLSLAVSPWGEVYVNGQYRGVSPPMTELLLPPGTYQVQIRNSEFTPNEQKVTIEAGKRRRITAKFR
jgi:PEGA domain